MKKEVKIMREPGTTTRIMNQTTTNSSPKRNLISINAVVTGAIAVVMWCILPIIPILLAFCAGHFVRDNGDKLKKEREEYERLNSRRH